MSQPLVLTSLPLFPLASLLFPGGVVALRVFEVRYLDMVRKCHLAGAPFGVVSLRSGQEVRRAGAPLEQLHEVGTLATIEQLRSPQPGLVTLECRGGQRFRIVRSHLLPHGLWVADVELLAPDQHVPIPQHLAATARSLAQVLASLRERTPSSPVAITPTPAQLGDCGWWPTAGVSCCRCPRSTSSSSCSSIPPWCAWSWWVTCWSAQALRRNKPRLPMPLHLPQHKPGLVQHGAAEHRPSTDHRDSRWKGSEPSQRLKPRSNRWERSGACAPLVVRLCSACP